MKEWFLSREPRERLILTAGALVAALIVFWGFIWMPLRDGSMDLRDSVAQKTQLLVDVQRAAALAPAAGAQRPAAANQSLVLLVDGTSQTHGLTGALTRTRPDGADRINVTFQNASFDSLLSWLTALQSTHGVRVESATVNGTRAPGLVNGQLLLSRL